MANGQNLSQLLAGMNVKFKQTTFAAAEAAKSTEPGTIFFTTDGEHKHTIMVGGVNYGVGTVESREELIACGLNAAEGTIYVTLKGFTAQSNTPTVKGGTYPPLTFFKRTNKPASETGTSTRHFNAIQLTDAIIGDENGKISVTAVKGIAEHVTDEATLIARASTASSGHTYVTYEGFETDLNSVIPTGVYLPGTVFVRNSNTGEYGYKYDVYQPIQTNTKADLIDGKVPTSQLPSYVEEVEELDVVLVKTVGSTERYLKGDTPKSVYEGTDIPSSYDIVPVVGKYYNAVTLNSGTSFNNVTQLVSCSPSGTWAIASAHAKKSVIYVTVGAGDFSNKTWRCSNESDANLVEISASPGTTDNVPEGTLNKYFTVSRAQQAVVGSTETSQNISALSSLIEAWRNGSLTPGTGGDTVTYEEGVLKTNGVNLVTANQIVQDAGVEDALEAIATQLTWG